MRRVPALVALKPLVLVSIAVAILAPACGVIADDDAATLAGRPIPASLVDAVASDEAFAQLLGFQAATGESVLPGSTARTALGFVLEAETLFAEAERQGVEFAADDSALAQQLEGAAVGADDLSADVRELAARYVGASNALVEQGSEPPAPTEQELRLVYDATEESWDQTCVTIVAAPATALEDIESALEDGAALAELPEAVEGATVAADAESACLTSAEVATLPEELVAEFDLAEDGELVGAIELELEQPTIVWFEIERRGVLSFEEALPQLAELAAQSRVALLIARDAEINPRYGDGVELTTTASPNGAQVLVARVGRPEAPEPVLPVGGPTTGEPTTGAAGS